MRNILCSLALLLVLPITGCKSPDFGTWKEAGPPVEEFFAGRDRPYIDTHNHLFGGTDRGEQDYFSAAGTALTTMGRLGIQKMMIMPPPLSPLHPFSFKMEDLIPAVRKTPDRFAVLGGGGSLNIMIHQAKGPGKVTPQLKKRFRERAFEILSKGAVGFGELAVEHFSFNHNHPYESVPADHPLLLLLADIAAERGVPIDIHMEAIPQNMPLPDRLLLTRSGRNPKTLRGNIRAFETLLSHNVRAKIIWAHVGWCNTGARTPGLCRELLTSHPNLYMSFKLSPESLPALRPINMERKAVRPEWLRLIRDFPDRFVIGTDQFYSPPGSRRIGPQKTEATRLFMNLLPPDLAQKIGLKNPKSLFNL